jgi:flagellar biosynthesis/type III secretory pathway protein FliH
MLPADAYERAVAEQILLRLQHVLERKPNQTPEEQEFIVTMYNTWEKARELGLEEGIERGIEKGLAKGLAEGLKKGQLNLLLRQLRARFGELPAAVITRIEAADTAELEQWAERVLNAKTLPEVLGEPS